MLHLQNRAGSLWNKLSLVFFAFGMATPQLDDFAFSQTPPPVVSPQVSPDELPRTPPKSPEESKACIQVLSGFEIELVAAEPLVVDPIAFSFDSRGRLFVVEMIDYSEQETEALGRIALLEDLDGNGTMDKRSTFVDRLSWPTAVHPWKDGVLVIAPPKMTWYRDTDEDGKHDIAEEWFSGFGRSNVQGMANSLRWSVDGYLVGVTSSTGAELTTTNPNQSRYSLRGRDFRIDPVSKKLEPLSGGSQNGMSMNRWGDRFVTSNSDHLQQVIDLDDWLGKHDVSGLPITSRRSIAVDGPQAEVFRASPVEPWRIVRTRMRVSGEAPGAIEGGGRAAGYFTGASGTWVMDAEMGFGATGFDTAFACDSGSNLVHRKKLEGNGLFWKADRIDEQTELVRSSEVWFRPVQLGDGPDGALYIADMYREVIEHPKSIPQSIKDHLDLTSGNDRGRIWRVKRADSKATSVVDLAKRSNPELVSMLSDSISWRRRSASQLLIERQARDITEQLKATVTNVEKPEASVLAIHLLNRLNLLDVATLSSAIAHPNPTVNRHALDLVRTQSEFATILQNEKTIETLIKKSDDARLCLSLAMAVADLPTDSRMKVLPLLLSTTMERFPKETTLHSVIIAAAGAESFAFIDRLETLDSKGESRRAQLVKTLLPRWLQQLPKSGESSPSRAATELSRIMREDIALDPARRSSWLSAALGLKNRVSLEKFLGVLSDKERMAFTQPAEVELQKAVDEPKRRSQTAVYLRVASAETRASWLKQFIGPRESEATQSAIVDACMIADPSTTSSTLLSRYAELGPKLREVILQSMVQYPESTLALADAIEMKTISPSQLPPTVRQTLEKHPNSDVRKRFTKLLETSKPTSDEIQKIIDAYRPTVDTVDAKGSAVLARGKAAFEKNCAACHRIENLGNDVGPPLKSLHEKSPEQLLISILDPNREVDPRFQAWVVLLDDGRVLTGIIREETANGIVLAEANGKLTPIERSEIEQLKGSGVSLMPTGLNQQLTQDSAAELIAWLRSLRK